MSSRKARVILRTIVLAWMALLVLVPVCGLMVRAWAGGPTLFWAHVSDPVALSALRLTFGTAALAATINAMGGTLIAWVLVRGNHPGLSALVDIPFAVPTLVTGVVLVALFGPQAWLGQAFIAMDTPVVFARPGIVLAMLFISLPLVVRTVEPVLSELDPAEEDAAATLGASRWQVLRHVLWPAMVPAVAAAWVQTFARCIAEFGSIAALSGNIPRETLVASVYILGELEAGHAESAATVSVVLLVLALVLQPAASALVERRSARV